MTTEQMKQRITELRDLAANLRAQADVRDKLADGYQAELDAKELAAYWATHPELEKVNVGYRLGSNILWDVGTIPTRQEVAQIDLATETATVRYWRKSDYNPRYISDLPLVIVCDTRRAYLSQHQETE